MDDFETYCRDYLEAWEARSTVRAMTRYRPSQADSHVPLLPEGFVPLVDEPEVQAMGPEVKRLLVTQACYRIMDGIALIETDMICECCRDLAHRSQLVEVPALARQVALAIHTDEGYHSFAAREFMDELTEITGIQPDGRLEDCSSRLGLDAVLAQLSPELHGAFRMVALSLTENLVTDEVIGLVKETELISPFHLNLREHLMDEARHQAFFRRLLRRVWAAFDPEIRTSLAQVLPLFLDFLLERPMREDAKARLESVHRLGLDGRTLEHLRLREEARLVAKADNPTWGNVRRAMGDAGLLDAPEVQSALRDGGWLVV
ncbi:MAG: diiron oxygenase [Rhodospirillum sp.]|nr:diiron oxygenase [Rhodospirillum sp.]MCF8487678.1 diiron oxygenase [Rhodospirillum sp.]MCF8499574.1 diiron oxygenase [Rhodospirillum sp.]